MTLICSFYEEFLNAFCLYQKKNLLSGQLIITLKECIDAEKALKFSTIYVFLKDTYVLPIHFNLKELVSLVNELFPSKSCTLEQYESLQSIQNKYIENQAVFKSLVQDQKFELHEFIILISTICASKIQCFEYDEE